jgi:predicted nucleic acid-binding protein
VTPLTPSRVVLDTNQIIGAGSRWLAGETPQPVSLPQRLVHWVATRHVGLYCREILAEYVDVLIRRNHPRERITLYVAYLKALFTDVTITLQSCHTPPADPDDVIFVLCALNGDADFLVSEDSHILAVRHAYHPRPAIVPPEEARTHLSVPSVWPEALNEEESTS